MSSYAITPYRNDLEKCRSPRGYRKETAIRFAFQKLLEEDAKMKDLKLVPEIFTKNKHGRIISPTAL